jgi:hypothetical protein
MAGQLAGCTAAALNCLVRRIREGVGVLFVGIAGDGEAELISDQLIQRGAERIGALWERRLVPFEANLRSGRRAPRRQRAELAGPDPTWPAQAQRLIGRLLFSVAAMIKRVDHIGSTSVPGLPEEVVVDADPGPEPGSGQPGRTGHRSGHDHACLRLAGSS